MNRAWMWVRESKVDPLSTLSEVFRGGASKAAGGHQTWYWLAAKSSRSPLHSYNLLRRSTFMTACQGEPLPLPLLLGKINFLLETDAGGQQIVRLQQVTACYPELLIFTAFKYHLNLFELVIEKTHLVKDSECLSVKNRSLLPPSHPASQTEPPSLDS